MVTLPHPLLTDQHLQPLIDETLTLLSGDEDEIFDFSTLLESPLSRSLTAILTAHGLSAGDQVAVHHVLFQRISLLAAGDHMYRMSPGLLQRLMSAKLPNIKPEFIRFPYRSIWVSLPEQSRLTIFQDDTGRHPLRGFYLTETQEEDSRFLRLMAAGGANKIYPHEDSTIFFRVNLDVGDSLAESRKHHEENARMEHHLGYGRRVDAKTMRREVMKDFSYLFRLAINTLLYITSIDAEVKSVHLDPARKKAEEGLKKAKRAKQTERARQALRKTTPGRIMLLGGSLVPIPKRPSGTGSASWDPKEGYRLHRDVAGHWKTIHTKEGPQVRWVESYQRGQWVRYGATEGYEVK